MTDALLVTMLLATISGILLTVLSSRFRQPAVGPLLAAGVLLGPMGFGIIQPGTMGEGLSVLTRIGVAVILFDGGLALKTEDFQTAPNLIRRLLTLGLLVTWLTITLAIFALFPFAFGDSLLAASLVIVTGPTVILPILRRVRVQPRLHSVLLWEGILIDPIGVFIATLCFELLAGQTGGALAVSLFAGRFATGLIIGWLGGILAAKALRERWIADEHVNLFALGMALLVFFLCEALFHESGLLGALAAGFFLARNKPPGLDNIHKFKGEISELLISVLFVLLAANLDLSRATQFGWKGLLLVAIVILVARPLSILVSAHGEHFALREKLFLSWLAPRGIVAASMASLFAMALMDTKPLLAEFLQLFTFAVIGFTVLIQGLSAGWVARLLHVDLPNPYRWMVVGAHSFGQGIARFLDHNGLGPTLLVDINSHNVNTARQAGMLALEADATRPHLLENEQTTDIGNVLALTDNETVNALACQLWSTRVGHAHVHRWAENTLTNDPRPGEVVWPGLPPPGTLSLELDHGVVQWQGVSDDEPTDTTKGYWSEVTRLLALQDRLVSLQPDKTPHEKSLTIRHKAPEMLQFLHPETCGRLTAADKQEMIRGMLERICERHDTIPYEQTLKELLAREAQFSTAIGHGIAIPHAFVSTLSEPLISLGVVEEGIDFEGDDGQPVRLVFMVLGPHDPGRHLNLLAEIARLAEDPVTRNRLINADSDEERLRLLSWSQIG